MKRAVGAVLAVASALAVSACTQGGESGGGPSSPSTSASVSASTTAGPPGASGAPPASSPAPTGQASDAVSSGTLQNAQCVDQGGGSWLFTGRLHNATGSTLTITVAVALTSNAGALVVGHSSYSETLAAGEQRDVTLPLSADGAPSADCSFVASQEVAR